MSVTKQYLAELRDENMFLKAENYFLRHENEELEDQVGTLLAEFASAKIRRRKPPVYRKAA